MVLAGVTGVSLPRLHRGWDEGARRMAHSIASRGVAAALPAPLAGLRIPQPCIALSPA